VTTLSLRIAARPQIVPNVPLMNRTTAAKTAQPPGSAVERAGVVPGVVAAMRAPFDRVLRNPKRVAAAGDHTSPTAGEAAPPIDQGVLTRD
jgi:hypothetical protein